MRMRIPFRYTFASEKFAKFDFTDPLNIQSLLTEEEKMVNY
jgi:hypothetical protein